MAKRRKRKSSTRIRSGNVSYRAKAKMMRKGTPNRHRAVHKVLSRQGT